MANDFMKRLLVALGGPAAIDRQTLVNVRRRLHVLFTEGEIGTSAYGALLITLGADYPAAHADCNMQLSDPSYPGDNETKWKDHTGRTWDLEATYADRYGKHWQWSGGFQADPDTQPLMSRFDWSECDIPLCRAWAAVGPLVEVER